MDLALVVVLNSDASWVEDVGWRAAVEHARMLEERRILYLTGRFGIALNTRSLLVLAGSLAPAGAEKCTSTNRLATRIDVIRVTIPGTGWVERVVVCLGIPSSGIFGESRIREVTAHKVIASLVDV